jgi:predicted MFS family arabinose efflux permease
MILFIVVYGLDWVATVPPTAVLCRRVFGDQGTIVFGWVFASHQLGAAAAALTAGIIRDTFDSYTYAWFGGAALCLVAAVLSIALRKQPDVGPTSAATTDSEEKEIEAEIASDLTP